MTNRYPEQTIVSSNPNSPMTMDEPDFSGLMALTEASIRQKISELKYPESDVLDTQNEEDSDQKFIPLVIDQPDIIHINEPQKNGQIQAEMSLVKGSKVIGHKNLSSDCEKSGLIDKSDRTISVVSSQEGVTDNRLNLMSALDEPELVRIASIGLKSAKTKGIFEQKVKYCGLNVELPVENKSPEIEKTSETINNNIQAANENKSPELSEADEKEMYVLEIHDDDDESPEFKEKSVEKETEEKNCTSDQFTERNNTINETAKQRVSSLEKGSGDTVKYCGLNMEIAPQKKIGSTQQEQEFVTKTIDFESENKVSNMKTVDKNISDIVQNQPYFKAQEPPSSEKVNKKYEEKSYEQLNRDDRETETTTYETETASTEVASKTHRPQLTNESERMEEKENTIDKSEHLITVLITENENKETVSKGMSSGTEEEGAALKSKDIIQSHSNASSMMEVDVDKSLTESERNAGNGNTTKRNDLGLVINDISSAQDIIGDGDDIQTLQVNDTDALLTDSSDKETRGSQQQSKPPSKQVAKVTDVLDDFVMMEIENGKSLQETNLITDTSTPKLSVSLTETNLTNESGSISGDVSQMINTQVCKVREDNLIKEMETVVENDVIAANVSNDSINEAKTKRNESYDLITAKSESNDNSVDGITIAEVVSLGSAKKLCSEAIPSETNAELSALESMLMKVTPQGLQKDESKTLSVQEKSISNSAENAFNCLNEPNSMPVINNKDKTEKQTHNVNQLISKIQRKDEARNHTDQSNITESIVGMQKQKNDNFCQVNTNKETENVDKDTVDPNKSLAISVCETSKTGETPLCENIFPSDGGDMLMITNVRTITPDEEEKLTEETNKKNGSQKKTSDSDKLNENHSIAGRVDETNNFNKTTNTSTTETLPVRTASSRNANNSNSAIMKSSSSGYSARAAPAKSVGSARLNSSFISPTAFSNTGTPMITNTFTIKQEPIDYVPYGMPNMTVSSSTPQPVTTQHYSVSSEGLVKGISQTWWPSLGVQQQERPVKVVRRDRAVVPDFAPAPSHYGHQFANMKIPNGVPLIGTQQTSYIKTQVLQKSVNYSMPQHQKSPANVVSHMTSKAPSKTSAQSLVYQVGLSQASHTAAPSVKNQLMKRYTPGTQVQSVHNPATVSVPIKPAQPSKPTQPSPVPSNFFALNLKTINIETVGIPMITEMIARKNPVPVYKPPPPPKSVLGDEKTKQTFPCYECGDTFYLISSLEQHTYRCSMKISYKCEWCKKILEFTNKCQLLSHLRSHMNIDKNQAVPIHIKSDSIEIQTNFDDIIPGKEFKWFKIPEKEYDVRDSQYLINTNSVGQATQVVRLFKAHECSECKLTFYKKDDRAKAIHFAPDKNVKPIFCGKCPMYLHNHCGIKAHRRLHEDIEKLDFLVCPECGMCYENKPQILPVFLKHLKTRCFHLSRFSTLRCSKCNANCTSVDELNHHLITSVEQYYKCNKCPMALKTLKSFISHFKQVHDEKSAKHESVHDARAKIIYRCHVCDTLIDDKEFLLSHIEKHLSEIKEQASMYFHCLQCGLIFFEKKSLVEHFEKHKPASSETFCTLCRSARKSPMEYTQHIFSNHVAPVFKLRAQICNDCGLVCVDAHKLRIHECHMKTVAFVVHGDSSAAAAQKEQKTKSPRKEEAKAVVKDKVKEGSNKEINEVPRREERTQSAHKQSPVKVENAVSKYRPIMPKPSKVDDEIPHQYQVECPYCCEVYSSNFRRIEHFRNHKKDGVFICPYCENMEFKTSEHLEIHENECWKDTNLDYLDPVPKHLSKKCPSCNYVYGGNRKRLYHIKAHRGDKVYICAFCDAMNFTEYPELRSHEVLCSALNKTTVKSTDKSPSANKIKLKISKGKPSKKSSPDQPAQYQLEYKCDDCGQCFSRKEKQEEHTRLEHGIHPCHLCGLMYESQTSLKKHLLISHEGKRCVYYCWVCKRRRKFFSDVSNLQKHFTMKHKYRVWDPAKAVPALPGLETQNNNAPQPAKRRLETTPERPDTPVKKLRIMSDKGFKCAKCNFMSEERKDFEAHIKEHKTKDSVQCIECGLCFMVIPSLKKHLFMVHKVKDFDTYLKEHNIDSLKEIEECESEKDSDDEELIIDEPKKVEEESEESEEEEGNPLECKVCYKKFETEHLMKSHMRVHGMAFIKKTRRSLCSAAKKQKLDSKEAESMNVDRTKSVEKHSKFEKEEIDIEMADDVKVT